MAQNLGGTAMFQILPGAMKYGKQMMAKSPKATPKTFVDHMSPSEAARYRAYWHNAKLNQASPGTQSLSRMQLSANGQYTYLSTTHFDQFGRRIAETHYTTHPSTGVLHPNPHYHLYNLNNQRLPLMPGPYLGE